MSKRISHRLSWALGACVFVSSPSVHALSGQDVQYQYDALGRLTASHYADGEKDLVHCYDAAGNRKFAFVSDITVPPVSDPTCVNFEPPPPISPPFSGSLVVVPLRGFKLIVDD